MADKRYYWLKLNDDFFHSKRIKKLRKLAGGDTFTIIYLKMQLLSLKNGGTLYYSGLESTFAEELALDIDEEPDNVLVTINFLMSCGLLETTDQIEFVLPFVQESIGSESLSAERVRKYREKQKALQCNNNVTDVTSHCSTDIEKDIEIETDKEKNKRSKPKISEGELNEFFNSIWKLYPRKLGKGGVSKTQKEKLYKIGFDELARCIERFKTAMIGTDEKYIMYGSTFFNSGYADYLDENFFSENKPKGSDSDWQ